MPHMSPRRYTHAHPTLLARSGNAATHAVSIRTIDAATGVGRTCSPQYRKQTLLHTLCQLHPLLHICHIYMLVYIYIHGNICIYIYIFVYVYRSIYFFAYIYCAWPSSQPDQILPPCPKRSLGRLLLLCIAVSNLCVTASLQCTIVFHSGLSIATTEAHPRLFAQVSLVRSVQPKLPNHFSAVTSLVRIQSWLVQMRQ